MRIFDHVDPKPDVSKRQHTAAYMLLIAFTLAGIRFFVFKLIYSHLSRDAMWQFEYLPLGVLDFPVSIVYFALPIPFGEEFLGPIWWFAFPILVWRHCQKRKRTSETTL